MISIALVDDHEIVRQGLHSFLSEIDDFSILAEGNDGKSAINIVSEFEPDILLLDMILPDITGLEAFIEIKKLDKKTKIIFLSSYSNADSAIPAIRSGAAGYLLKDINPNDLIKAIREVKGGALKIHPDIAALLVEELNTKDDYDIFQQLTTREIEVLKLIGQGKSNKEIASELNISLLTVKTHVSHILDKMDFADRTQAAIFVVKSGII